MWQRFKLLLVLTVVLGGSWYLLAERPLYPKSQIYDLRSGMTLRSFADQLRHQGVIDAADPFIVLGHLEGWARDLKAGDYQFKSPTTPFQILSTVVHGHVVQYSITLVPGWTFQQVEAALARAPHLRDNIQGKSDRAIMKLIGHPRHSAQGSFFPDTYFYTTHALATSILARAYRRMHRLLFAEWKARDAHLPLKRPEQALILASLIEKETAKAGERRLIAGVFVNRLRKGMCLQTDPTVIFSLGTRYHGVLTSADMRVNSPFNTYIHHGLPPTPIGLPGAPAIFAALHPAKTQALYFVGTGGDGHVFSDTLQEQDRAIIRYELHGHP